MADTPAHEVSHGHSVAAWSGVGILLVASLLICLGLVLAKQILWVLGVVGVVAGCAAWVILDKVGYGEGGKHSH